MKAGGAKGSANSRSQSGNVHGTGGQCCMEMQAEGIRFQSAKYERVQNLMHNVNEQTLMAEHRKQSRRKAVGVDGVTED